MLIFSTYEKLIIYSFCWLYLCLQCDEVFMTLQYLWIQHTVPQDPPKIKKKITNFHQITSIFYMLLEDSFGVKSISKFPCGLEAYKMFMSSVDPCILIWGDWGIHLRLWATKQSSLHIWCYFNELQWNLSTRDNQNGGLFAPMTMNDNEIYFQFVHIIII